MLKTICRSCVFNKEPGCEFAKELIFEEDKQFTPGFCRHKRTFKWFKEDQDSKKRVCDENFKLSAIYLFEGDFELLDSFISLAKATGVDEVIVSCQSTDNESWEKVTQALVKSGLKWAVDKLLDETEAMPEMKVNYAVRLINNSWFFVNTEKEGFSGQDLSFIKYKLVQCPKHNFAGFYLTKDNNVNILANKFAFMEMGGNLEKPWLEKIHQADNAEYVCPQL